MANRINTRTTVDHVETGVERTELTYNFVGSSLNPGYPTDSISVCSDPSGVREGFSIVVDADHILTSEDTKIIYQGAQYGGHIKVVLDRVVYLDKTVGYKVTIFNNLDPELVACNTLDQDKEIFEAATHTFDMNTGNEWYLANLVFNNGVINWNTYWISSGTYGTRMNVNAAQTSYNYASNTKVQYAVEKYGPDDIGTRNRLDSLESLAQSTYVSR